MKITKRQLKRIIKEELARQPLLLEFGENWEELADEGGMEPNLKTVGDLRKLIKIMQSEKRAKKGIEGIKDMGTGLLADLFPMGGTIQTAGETLFNMYSAPDDKKTDTMLDKLNVDDEIAAIVDDTVEDNFLEQAVDALDAYGDDEDIPDINKELSNWLQSAYDQRTVAGFEEGKKIKITKRQLKRIIKEEKARLMLEMNPDGTISADEDVERDKLIAHTEFQLLELIQHIRDEAERIGGSFRSPGIRKEAFDLMARIIRGLR